MSNSRLQKSILLLLACMMLWVTFFHLTGDIRDPDFFWHLKTGEWIWQHGKLPAKDPFSYTTEGLESVRERVIMTSPWLSQVIFWLSYRVADMSGIVLLRFVIVGNLLFAMAMRKGGDRVFSTGLLLLFFVLLLKSYPIERPQVFSFLFFAVMLHLLEGQKQHDTPDKADSRYGRSFLIVLPLLMLVWANMHGGYVVGVAAILVYVTCEGIKFLSPALNPMKKRDYRMLLTAGVMGVLISFVNPNTYHVFADNILFQREYVTANNIEFQSTIRFFSKYHDPAVIIYWCILFLAGVGMLFTAKKTDISEAVLLGATGYFSFTALRYVAFFLIAALPVVARIFSGGKLLKPVRALVLAGSVAACIFFTSGHIATKNLMTGNWIDAQKFPVAGADFIRANDLRGNMYNYFDWGGYLIWRLAPERKVFIDGRTLYPHTYHQSDVIDTADARPIGPLPSWKAALEQYNVNYTVTPASLPLVRALSEDREWIPVFLDSTAVIFAKDTPENRHVIQEYALDKGTLLRWPNDRQLQENASP